MGEAGPVIAIQAGHRRIRAALVENGIDVMDSIAARPEQSHRIAHFVARHKRAHPQLRIVGSSLDYWSEELKSTLEREAGSIVWLVSLDKIAQLKLPVTPTKKRFRQSRFLAYVAQQEFDTPVAWLLLRWLYLMALESQQEVVECALMMGYHIDAPHDPDF